MKVLSTYNKKCPACGITHKIDTVEVLDRKIRNNVLVAYSAIYDYCSNKDEYVEDIDKAPYNKLRMLLAYEKILDMNSQITAT